RADGTISCGCCRSVEGSLEGAETHAVANRDRLADVSMPVADDLPLHKPPHRLVGPHALQPTDVLCRQFRVVLQAAGSVRHRVEKRGVDATEPFRRRLEHRLDVCDEWIEWQ